MATDAILILDQLRCMTLLKTESRVEPYIWPVLVRIDDNTIATPELLSVIAPALGNARVVIKDSMRAGETASIPVSVGVQRTRFDDHLNLHRLLLVVALLENDETPQAALRAGFQAFSSELGLAIADNLLALSTATGDAEKELIDTIKTRVSARVRAATGDALTSWEKIKVATGILDLDDFVSSDFKSFGKTTLASESFTLNFETSTKSGDVITSQSQYQITGRLQVKPVVAQRCQAQLNAVVAAQTAVNDIEHEISDLQAQLHGQGDEPPLPKAYLVAEIKRIRDEELGPAMQALQQARLDLQACRDRGRVVGGIDVGGVLTAS